MADMHNCAKFIFKSFWTWAAFHWALYRLAFPFLTLYFTRRETICFTFSLSPFFSDSPKQSMFFLTPQCIADSPIKF